MSETHREWDDPFNPFNSIKALTHGRRFQAIVSLGERR